MTNFVTDRQFRRARKIVRKLLYKNTMQVDQEYPNDFGHLNYDH